MCIRILRKDLRLGPHLKDVRLNSTSETFWKCLTPITTFYYYEPLQVIVSTLSYYIKTVTLQFNISVPCRQTGRCAYVAQWERVSAGIRRALSSSLSCANSYVAVVRRSGTWNEFYCLLDFCLVHKQMVGWVFFFSPALFGSVKLLCFHCCWKIDWCFIFWTIFY